MQENSLLFAVSLSAFSTSQFYVRVCLNADAFFLWSFVWDTECLCLKDSLILQFPRGLWYLLLGALLKKKKNTEEILMNSAAPVPSAIISYNARFSTFLAVCCFLFLFKNLTASPKVTHLLCSSTIVTWTLIFCPLCLYVSTFWLGPAWSPNKLHPSMPPSLLFFFCAGLALCRRG